MTRGMRTAELPENPVARNRVLGALEGLVAQGRHWALLQAVQEVGLDRDADPRLRAWVDAALAALGLPLAGEPAPRPLSEGRRRELLEANLAVLAGRGGVSADGRLHDRLRSVLADAAEEAMFAEDGNVVLRPRGEADIRRWAWIGDFRAAAAAAPEAFVAERGVKTGRVLLEGIAPPWHALAVREEFRRADLDPAAQGFRRGLLVVEPDERAASRALSVVDCSAALADEAVEWFLGQGAWGALGRWLDERMDLMPPRRLAMTPRDPQRAAAAQAAASEAMSAAAARQQDELARLLARVARAYDGRGAEEVAGRLADGLARGGLRVLISGSRFTSYVRHAAADLAASLRAMGHEALIVSEPSASDVLASPAYARAVGEFVPDVVVVANYGRASLANVVPECVPIVCWVQDAMEHLFDPKLVRTAGPLDVFIGYSFTGALADPALEGRRVLTTVPASEIKFHPGPVPDGARERHGADMVFISNHGEPPEVLRDRLIAGLGGTPVARRLMEAVWSAANRLVAEAATRRIWTRLDEEMSAAFRSVAGRAPQGAELGNCVHQMLVPLVGRLFRHEGVRWAARLAERNGWTLRLHGTGWSETPEFARYAAGPIEHGEELRACYQSAAVTLHLDPNTLTHQRVLEAALSGGLPAARFCADALGPLETLAFDQVRRDAEPERRLPDGRLWYQAVDSEAGLRLLDLKQRLGVPVWPRMCASPEEPLPAEPPEARSGSDPAFLYGDLAELSFADEAGLERLVARARGDAAWRSRWSSIVRSRALEVGSTRAFASRMLALCHRAAERAAAPAGVCG